jgi:hypothetical protein
VVASSDMPAGPPEKKLRWDRLILAFLLIVGLIAGAFLLITR